MNKKNIIFLILTIFLSGCFSENRFVNGGIVSSFTFGIYGDTGWKCEKKYNPNWPRAYINKVNPTRICQNYYEYKCVVNHYCKGDKQCEKEAADYWLSASSGGNPDVITNHCEESKRKCDSAPKGDQTCRK